MSNRKPAKPKPTGDEFVPLEVTIFNAGSDRVAAHLMFLAPEHAPATIHEGFRRRLVCQDTHVCPCGAVEDRPRVAASTAYRITAGTAGDVLDQMNADPHRSHHRADCPATDANLLGALTAWGGPGIVDDIKAQMRDGLPHVLAQLAAERATSGLCQ